MAHIYDTTIPNRKHLQFEQRVVIAYMLKKNVSKAEIARELDVNRSTITREIRRGSVQQLNYQGKYVLMYFADAAQMVADENSNLRGRRPRLAACKDFLDYVDNLILKDKFSPDAACMEALRLNKFTRNQMVCTKTLYNYIDQSIMNSRNIDLVAKLRRKPRRTANRVHKRIFGSSIGLRPSSVEDRLEFGHWEIDCVLLTNTKEKVLLTLVERLSRQSILAILPGKTAYDVNHALADIQLQYGDMFPKVFKTITSDNGSEFSMLNEQVGGMTEVYYAHPYSSWERGSNERNNGMIRRFIPKGYNPEHVTESLVRRIEDWLNNYPRRILKCKTSSSIFLSHLLPLAS